MFTLQHCFVFAALASAFPTFAEFTKEERGFYPQQVHLSLSDDANSVFVTWTTLQDAGDAFLFVEGYPGQWRKYDASNKTLLERSDTTSNETRATFVYRARMIGLNPGYLYRYKVGTQNYTSGIFVYTHQATDPESTPSFAIYGDLALNAPMTLPKLVDDANNGAFQTVFHLGDIGYELADDLGEKGDKFMNLLQPLAAKIPYNFIVGNHERHNNFSEFSGRFTSPGPSVFYHSYNIGPIHFVVFSSSFYVYYEEYGIGQIQAQYNWLAEDLKQANTAERRSKQPWIVVLGHRRIHCPNDTFNRDCEKYKTIKSEVFDDKIMDLEQLFYQNGVDLQFYGHYHGYRRTFPTFRDALEKSDDVTIFKDPGYPIHVISGVASWDNEDFKESPDAVNLSELGYSILRVMDKYTLEITLESTVFSQTIDKFEVSKSGDFPAFGVREQA